MTKSRTSYISLKPTLNSQLDIGDIKNLLGYLSSLSHKNYIELVTTSRGNGIELFIGLEPDIREAVIKHIYALCPTVIITNSKVSEVGVNKLAASLKLNFKRHYAYPLYKEDQADQNSLLTLLADICQTEEREAVQISLKAVNIKPLRSTLLKRQLLSGKQPVLLGNDLISRIFKPFTLTLNLTASSINVIGNLLGAKQTNQYSHYAKVVNPKYVMMLDKLYEPLFKTSLEVKIKARSPKRTRQLIKATETAINNFAASNGYQQFKISRNQHSDIYSASDLASLFHFNQGDLSIGIFNVEQFKRLPKPKNIPSKTTRPGDLTLGFNSYQGAHSNLIIQAEDRYRHTYICGATGSGKSSLMANLIIQDLNSGQGLTLIDPHGDLAQEVMLRIPKNRRQDVIYFNPSDASCNIKLNLMEHQFKSDTAGFEAEADQICENIISFFRKLFGEELSGHRIEYILRNTIHTCLNIPSSNIFTIYRLLTDGAYRFKVTANLSNQDLANFWRNEIGKAGEYQRVKMTAGVTAKIGRLLFSEPSRRVFGHSESTLNIDKLMNDRQVLICNFAKGELGEDGSKLFATAMLSKLLSAALSRVRLQSEQRPSHYLYVDEFQSYAPSILIQLLSETRKYGLYLTMAEQSPSQQDSRSTSAILANVANLICFRTASPKDEQLLLPLFKDYLLPSDLNNLPLYNFYLKSTGTKSLPPTSGQTYPLPEDDGINLALKDVYSRTKELNRLPKPQEAI